MGESLGDIYIRAVPTTIYVVDCGRISGFRGASTPLSLPRPACKRVRSTPFGSLTVRANDRSLTL